ncbi:MAG: hypothetical protein H2069_02245 [Legionella sp.]|nr:hypothetical protein [Legionella sp.]
MKEKSNPLQLNPSALKKTTRKISKPFGYLTKFLIEKMQEDGLQDTSSDNQYKHLLLESTQRYLKSHGVTNKAIADLKSRLSKNNPLASQISSIDFFYYIKRKNFHQDDLNRLRKFCLLKNEKIAKIMGCASSTIVQSMGSELRKLGATCRQRYNYKNLPNTDHKDSHALNQFDAFLDQLSAEEIDLKTLVKRTKKLKTENFFIQQSNKSNCKKNSSQNDNNLNANNPGFIDYKSKQAAHAVTHTLSYDKINTLYKKAMEAVHKEAQVETPEITDIAAHYVAKKGSNPLSIKLFSIPIFNEFQKHQFPNFNLSGIN